MPNHTFLRCLDCSRRIFSTDPRCVPCQTRHAQSVDELVSHVLKAFPAAVAVTYESGVTMIDMSKVDLWAK